LFDVGAWHAGFRPVLAVEFYPAKGKKDDKVKQRQSAAAADNYERNLGKHIVRKSIEDAVRDRVFANHIQQHGRPNAFHCSPSCTVFSQGNTKGVEDEGDISAATAVTGAIAQLDFPEIFTLENVEAYQKSNSWAIIRDFLYANGYGVSSDVVMASDYGNLETGEGVPQDRKRFIVRAVKNHFAPPLPPKVPQRMGWLSAIADLIEDLPEGELAPWQLQRLPDLVKSALIDAKNIHPNGKITTREFDQPAFTVMSDDRCRTQAYLVRNDNTKQEWGKGYREGEEPSATVTATYVPSAVLLNGQNASGKEVPHRQDDEPAFSITTEAKWASALLVERAGASDARITVRTAEEPAWTLRSSIGTDQDGRNRNEVMNVVMGYRVKRLNARAIARLQSVPDWYELPDQMKDAGPLLGNGVPCLLAEAIMKSLLPFLQKSEGSLPLKSQFTLNSSCAQTELDVQSSETALNGLCTPNEISVPVNSQFTPNSDRGQSEFTLLKAPNSTSPQNEALNGLRTVTENLASVQSQFNPSSVSVQSQFTLSSIPVKPLKPFLKWAGGKTWAIALLEELYAPHRHKRYRDLTLGSGAIPLALKPDRAYLSDKNPFLIQLWEWVKADGKLTIDLRVDKDYYLQCYQRFNAGDPQQAELFYYLNHTCWRGLYRSSGVKHFNVPWGDYKKFHGQTDLTHYKEVIGGWKFAVESWDEGLRHVQDDDFIVFDPPYHSADGKGFTEYFGSFTEADQVLAAQTLSELGVPVVAFNAKTDFILDLYRGLNFDVQIKEAPRMIPSTGDRAPALEMVATKNTQEQKLVYIENFLESRQAQPDDSDLMYTNRVHESEVTEGDLTYDEQRDRAHLERKVEGAFYEAGKALKELRDRRLYRTTHIDFESYCLERFGFGRQNAHKQIKASEVFEILSTNRVQTLPSCVDQAAPLAHGSLSDEQRVKLWEDLTQDGKRPNGKKIKNAVAEICDRQVARGEYHNPWLVGDLCQIHKKGDGTLAKYDGMWAIVREVKTRQCIVKVWDGELLVKAENLEPLELGEEFIAVCDRVRSLMSRHINGDITLKRGQLRFLEALGEQAKFFEPEDVEMLAYIENLTANHDASLKQATQLLVENIEDLSEVDARSLYDALRTVHEF
jgi:DNA adenine methylase